MELSECPEPGQGEKYPDSFPNKICMGEFPTGPPVGVCGFVFFNHSAPHKQHCAASSSHPETETPQAHPQEADNSVDMPVAAEEVASVITKKQSAKVHGLGGCQAKFDIKLFNLLGFCLTVFWRCFSCFLPFKSHIWQGFFSPTKINTGFYLENTELLTENPGYLIMMKISSNAFSRLAKLGLNCVQLKCCSGLRHALSHPTSL